MYSVEVLGNETPAACIRYLRRVSQSISTTHPTFLDPGAQLVNEDLIESAPEDISYAAFAKSTESTDSFLGIDVPNMLPEGYGRVFHPKILLHELIANLVIYHIVDLNSQRNGFAAIPEKLEMDTCLYKPPTTTPSSDQGQQIAIASYINPLGEPATWQRLLAYDSNKISVLVANVLNGPDYIVEDNWKLVIDQAAGQGKTILGYVRTGYLGVSQQKFTTRLGSHNLADWASQIEQDVDKWFELYSSLGGIFFDEGWPECGDNNIYADLYAYINNYTKRKHPGAYTVLNPGSPMAQCFENTMDTLLTFESSYENYQSSYVPNDWTPTDPRKIWHIVYRVPQDQVANVAAFARSRGAGLLEVTDDDNPNPYDTLPNDAYMQAAINAVAGGKPPINDPAEATGSYVAGIPNDADISSSDYTSVTLTWSPVSNSLGYAVYRNGIQVLELPASMTRATVGMLEPGSSDIALEILTILASSNGGTSRLIRASTSSLPSNGSITNTGFTKNGNTVTYTADVLVPYAFVRLFIGIQQDDLGLTAIHGWPIDKPGVDSNGVGWLQIVNYLVEGNDFYSALYKYTGTWNEHTKANAEWSWSPIGVAPQVQSGYTYTWTVPFDGTDAKASEYIVQGQGYAPITNVFMGTPYYRLGY
ncbi:hypothetical protein ACEPPN_010810 [Leptodophora sp. 'Broadleaf-Isolate-01']